jgi:hypothetical protein
VSRAFQRALVQVNVVRDAADIRLVGICHHSNSHGLMLRQARESVKTEILPVIKSDYVSQIDFTKQRI